METLGIEFGVRALLWLFICFSSVVFGFFRISVSYGFAIPITCVWNPVDQVWFPKGFGLSSIGLQFEFPYVHFWETSTLGLGFQGFSYGFSRVLVP